MNGRGCCRPRNPNRLLSYFRAHHHDLAVPPWRRRRPEVQHRALAAPAPPSPGHVSTGARRQPRQPVRVPIGIGRLDDAITNVVVVARDNIGLAVTTHRIDERLMIVNRRYPTRVTAGQLWRKWWRSRGRINHQIRVWIYPVRQRESPLVRRARVDGAFDGRPVAERAPAHGIDCRRCTRGALADAIGRGHDVREHTRAPGPCGVRVLRPVG